MFFDAELFAIVKNAEAHEVVAAPLAQGSLTAYTMRDLTSSQLYTQREGFDIISAVRTM